MIVKDTETGLEWTKEYATNKAWQRALDYCETLNYGNYSDWRLPNIEELKTLIDDTIYSPASTFPGMPSSCFWSSSSIVNNPLDAWHVDFGNGYVYSNLKDYNYYARCVRDEGNCGNGIVQSEKGEECDDGNYEGGDGCSEECLIEDTHTCEEEPSVCVLKPGRCSLLETCVNGSEFVSQSVPDTMSNPGGTYSVSVTMKNTGNTAWGRHDPYFWYGLGSQNPYDNTNWGMARVGMGATVVQPGQNYTFTWNVTAPANTGIYNFQWRTVSEGKEWFGESSENVAVYVGTPPNPVTIGDGTSHQTSPISTYYNYLRSISIYTSGEIGRTGTISQLSWNIATTQNTRDANVRIYLRTTSGTIPSTTWSIAGSTLVFSGSYRPNTVGWRNFVLSTPFIYTSNNLEVFVETNVASYVEGGNTYYTTTGYNSHSFGESDTGWPSLSSKTARPNIRITFQ